MATTVKGQVAAINASTATSGDNDDSDGQGTYQLLLAKKVNHFVGTSLK